LSDAPAAGRNAALPSGAQTNSVMGQLHRPFGISADEPDSHAPDFSSAHQPPAATYRLPSPRPGWTPGLLLDEPSSGHPHATEASAPPFFDQHPGLAPVAATPTMEMHAAMQALEITQTSFDVVKSLQASIEDLVASMDVPSRPAQSPSNNQGRGSGRTKYFTSGRKNYSTVNQDLTAVGGRIALPDYANQPSEYVSPPMKRAKMEMEKLQARLHKHPAESVLKQRIDKLEKLIEHHLSQALEQAGID
jgi:hypothetical protein